ncbi:hypothetical protein CAMRE0001_2746 [Campylobacter rectus RM3267]|uniref:Uncharacterized protein n=1 Tax=Campylobacter rectus RM3267 TaxID=553218 RepID=B9D0U7_CAMRE|nr:hypothetical protein CAMRE0001_2746 [Campylobacter rectus RM3267]
MSTAKFDRVFVRPNSVLNFKILLKFDGKFNSHLFDANFLNFKI